MLFMMVVYFWTNSNMCGVLDTMILCLFILVALLYLKWILIILMLPLQIMYGYYQNHKSLRIAKFLGIPNWLIENLFKQGVLRYSIFNVGLIPSHHLRKWIYVAMGAHVSKNVILHFQTEIRSPWKLSIGKGSIIGDNAVLDARSGLEIGKNVNISSNVSIWTLQHDHRSPQFRCPAPKEKKMAVNIGDRVWLGSNVIVLPGVTIGEGAVCCAGSVVTKDVEPFAVVAGVPAKKVNERPRVLEYEFGGKSCCFY